MHGNRMFIGMMMLGLAAGSAGAADYFGLEHVEAGDAILDGVPTGPLSCHNLGSTGKDGVDVRIPPPPPDRTTLTIWDADFQSSTLPPGSTRWWTCARAASCCNAPGGPIRW